MCPLNRRLPRILEQYFSFFSASFVWLLSVCVCGLASFNKLFPKTTHDPTSTKLIHTQRRWWIDARWCINEREREKWIKRSASILLFLLAADVFFWSFHYESRVGSLKIRFCRRPNPKPYRALILLSRTELTKCSTILRTSNWLLVCSKVKQISY